LFLLRTPPPNPFQDAAERGRLGDDTYVTLRRGLGLGSGLHLALCLGRLFGTELSSRVGLHLFFPGALAVTGPCYAKQRGITRIDFGLRLV